MNVTPEMVRAEMDYRLERARAGARLEHARAARRHRPWWRRMLEQPNRTRDARFAA